MPNLLASWTLPARGERIYAEWRAKCDLFAAAYVWCCLVAPQSYWAVKYSVCESDYQQPFSDSIKRDPLLRSFPCVDEPLKHATGLPLILFNSLNSLNSEPAVCVRWFAANWWWSTPYVLIVHTFFYGAACMLFLPVCISLRLLFPHWWVMGGRTLILLMWRTYVQLSNIGYELTQGRGRANPMGYTNASRWEFHTMLIRTVLGGVQLRLQMPFIVFETFASILVPLIVCQFKPMSGMWVVEVVVGTCMGSALGLLINCFEEKLVRAASFQAEAEDPTPLGPVSAVKIFCRAVERLRVAVVESPVTREVLVTLTTLMVWIVLLVLLDDLVLFL